MKETRKDVLCIYGRTKSGTRMKGIMHYDEGESSIGLREGWRICYCVSDSIFEVYHPETEIERTRGR